MNRRSGYEERNRKRGATRRERHLCSEDSQSYTLFKVRETFISNTIIVASGVDISVSRVSLSQGLTLLVSEVGSEPIPRGSSKSDLNYFLFFFKK